MHAEDQVLVQYATPFVRRIQYRKSKPFGTEHDTGRNTVRIGFSLNPSYEPALNNLALILEKKGHLATAEMLLSQSVTARPDFAAAWMNLGIVQMSGGKFRVSLLRPAICMLMGWDF